MALALLHWFKQRALEQRVFSFVQEVLAPGAHQDSDDYVSQLLAAASSRTAGGVPFVVLLFSAGILLRSLHVSLNQVWGVNRKRPILVSIGLYAGILLFGPTVLGLTVAGTTGMRKLILSLHLPFYAELLVLGSALGAVLDDPALQAGADAPVRWRSAFAGG